MNIGQRGLRSAWRAGAVLVAGAGLTVLSAACGNGTGTAVSPSGAAPSGLDAKGGAVKAFTVNVSTPISSGASTLTVTVTNDPSTNPTSLSLGSVQIVVPDGLAVTSVGTFAGSRTWTTTWVSGQTIFAGAATGTQKLDPGQSITFHIGVVATICGDNTFTKPAGSSETLGGTFSPDWTLLSAAPVVTVTNCVVTECPAAPAIASAYLRNVLGMKPNDDPFKNIVAQVALHMTTEARFNGFAPCDAGYAAAVTAFVDQIVAQL